MAKKKAKTKTAKGEQMPLIDVGPENLEGIVKEVRQYKFHQQKRLFHLKKEIEQKQKVRDLVEQAHLTRLKDGHIKFEADSAIVEVTPQDDLITIKEKVPKRASKSKATAFSPKGKKDMEITVEIEELNFEKKTPKKTTKKKTATRKSNQPTQAALKAAEELEFKKRQK